MARVSKDPNDYPQISRPEEPEVWFKLRPVTMGDAKSLSFTQGGEVVIGFDLLSRLIMAWSYPDDPTPEHIEELDIDTTVWLIGQAKLTSNIREEPEKKDSNGSSPSGPQPEETSNSPESSAI